MSERKNNQHIATCAIFGSTGSRIGVRYLYENEEAARCLGYRYFRYRNSREEKMHKEYLKGRQK